MCKAFSLICTYTQCLKGIQESRIYNFDDCSMMVGNFGEKTLSKLTDQGKKDLIEKNLCPAAKKEQVQQRILTFCMLTSCAGEHVGTIVKICDDEFIKVYEFPGERDFDEDPEKEQENFGNLYSKILYLKKNHHYHRRCRHRHHHHPPHPSILQHLHVQDQPRHLLHP